MSNFVIKTSKKSVFASAHMPYGAYKALCTLTKDHNGKIGETPEGFFKATFDSVATAKNIKNRFDADYAEAHAAYAPKPAPVKKAPKTAKKGNAFDFGKVKGKTNKEKNKALHAILVGMGIADSRTPEYMSVWNARPWAK